MKCYDVYYANANATEGIIINQGGTDSGKTYGIMQNILLKIIYWNKDIDGSEDLVATIVNESIPNSKKGPYRIIKTIFKNDPWLYEHITNWNETERTIYFKNGFEMEFTSYISEQSAKQGKRQFAFFNEAQSIHWLIFWQVAKRTRKQVFIDYNPHAPFWAHEKLIGTDKDSNDLHSSVRLIISDHRHNGSLSQHDHDRTEKIQDKELWRVYARGLTGNISGLIFPNWTPIPPEQFPDVDCVGGLDFGWTNDPTALFKVAKVGDSIFVKELAYEAGMDMRTIKQLIDANGLEQQVTYADHAPENIAELRRLGVNVLMARKGQGSIKAGILLMKSMKWFYTNDSKNLKEELKRYEWVKDKATGKSTNVPIDNFNHAIDAIRYAFYTHYFRA
jgi:phage terminase large subunit